MHLCTFTLRSPASLDCGVYLAKQLLWSAEWHWMNVCTITDANETHTNAHFRQCHMRHQNSPSLLEGPTSVYTGTLHALPLMMNKILFLADKNACAHTQAHRHTQTSTVSPRRSPSIFIWVNKWCAWQWVNACALSLRAQMVAQSFALPCFV